MKKLSKITDKQISERGVQALSDRPNVVQQYGRSGLSATQLKLWFDNLATFLSQKLNEVIGTIAGDTAAEYIRVLLDDYGIDNLGALIQSFESGEFASKVLQLYPSASGLEKQTLQSIINDNAKRLSDTARSAKDAYDKSVDRTEVTYQLGDSGTVAPTGKWNDTVPVAYDGQFIWTRIQLILRDGTITTAYSIARFGDKGSTGAKGEKGEKGDKGDKGEKGDKGDSFYTFSVQGGNLIVKTNTAGSPDVTYSIDDFGNMILTIN